MNHAAALSAVYRALAHYRRRQANNPTDHSAREIAQMSMLAEYLHENHTLNPLVIPSITNPQSLLAGDIPQADFHLRSSSAA